MVLNKGLFSSGSDEWTTPRWLFDDLNARFQFTLDAAATRENRLCDAYYDKASDGLSHSWTGERVWCNCPYSQIADWAAKFRFEAKAASLIVALVPARTDTRWFQENIMQADLVHFVPGRLRFSDKGSAPFPSALAFWFGLKDICKRGRRG